MKKKYEYILICNVISTLAIICAASPEKIIRILTGYLWDEEEAFGIKETYKRANHKEAK
jgi:hypothetical protein